MPSPPDPNGRGRVVLEVDKSYLTFSSGHFTLFSATDREDLHGHTWGLACRAEAGVAATGLAFDYGALKKALMALCDELDEKVLLPTESPWLEVWREDGRTHARFDGEVMSLPDRDVLLLPIANASVEDLSHWALARLVATPLIQDNDIGWLEVKVSSGPGQRAVARWDRPATPTASPIEDPTP